MRHGGFDRGTPRPPFPVFELDWPRLIAKALVMPNGCWEWQAAKLPKGYGYMSIKLPPGSPTRTAPRGAHRIAYTLSRGLTELPTLQVCHTCDNPSCVNPEHLFLGTNKANSEDMVAKGRACDGERQGRSKLTWPQVQEIREEFATTRVTKRALAQRYGVSKTTISLVIAGVTWKRS